MSTIACQCEAVVAEEGLSMIVCRISGHWLCAALINALVSLAIVSSTQAAQEPIQLAKDTGPAALAGKSYDLVVIGGTPGGIACAVRGAREGMNVLLVQHNRHIGGMLT